MTPCHQCSSVCQGLMQPLRVPSADGGSDITNGNILFVVMTGELPASVRYCGGDECIWTSSEMSQCWLWSSCNDVVSKLGGEPLNLVQPRCRCFPYHLVQSGASDRIALVTLSQVSLFAVSVFNTPWDPFSLLPFSSTRVCVCVCVCWGLQPWPLRRPAVLLATTTPCTSPPASTHYRP